MRLWRPERVSRYVRAVAERRGTRWLRRLRLIGIALSALVIVAAQALPALFPQFLPRGAALPNGDPGLAVWRRAGTNPPMSATWNGFGFSTPSATAGIDEQRIERLAVSPTRNEAIVVGVKSDGKIRGERWNGTSWQALANNDLATVSETFWWGFDVAYESLSGDAVLVWNNGSNGTTGLSYQVWNGASWTPEATIATPVAGEPQHMQLSADPTSDEMVLVVSNETSLDYALVWDGAGWGNSITLTASGVGDDRTDVAVAYEAQSGSALVAYGRSSSSLLYRIWDGSWGAEQALPLPAGAAGTVRWATLASDPSSDRIALGVLTTAADVWLAVWDGAAWGSREVATTATPSLVVPGVSVAFEGATGQALAVYAENATSVSYRTWTPSGWSATMAGPDVGHVPNSMRLTGRQGSAEVMLFVQDSASQLSAARWDGTAWRPPVQLEANTGEVKNMPFAFAWLPAVGPNTDPIFSQDLADRSGAEGDTVSFAAPATDPDGDPVRYSAAGLPPGISIDAITGAITGTIRFPAGLASPYTVTVWADDGRGGSDVDTFSWTIASSPHLLFTTDANVSGGGSPGLSTWNKGAVLTLGDPGLAFDPPTTSGIVRMVQDLTVMGSEDTQTIHLVTRPITVGSGPSISLLPGDLLFVDKSGGTLTSLNTISVTNADLVRFRPATPGDYSRGSFQIVLERPLGAELRAVSLIESDVLVAPGVTIPRGDFILVPSGGDEDDDLWWYDPATVGAGTTSGSIVKLVEGNHLGVGNQIWGLDVLTTAAFGRPEGTILLSFDKDVTVLGLPVTRNDVVAVQLTSTSLGGAVASGTAGLLLDGSDIGLDTDGERFNGFDLVVINRPPTFDQDLGDRTSAEGDAVAVPAPATDPDGDAVTYSASGLPDGLTIDPATGLISGTIAYTAAATSPHSVQVRATDTGGLYALDLFLWTVTDVNRPPVVDPPGDQADAEGNSVSVTMTATDPDGDGITWSATGLPGGLSIDPSSGEVSGLVDFGAAADSPFSVTVTATDDGGVPESDSAAFLWTITDTNRPPIVDPVADQTGLEADVVSLTVTGADPDGDTLDWSAVGLPPGLSIDPGSGEISGTIGYEAAADSPFSVQVTATDDGDPQLADTVAFAWTVGDVNRTPIIQHPGDQADAEGAGVTVAMVAGDPDGDTLAWSATGLPPGLAIDPDSGSISGTVGATAASDSPYSVTVTVIDDGAPPASDSVAFSWVVTDTNRPPDVVAPIDQSDGEGDTVLLVVSGSDPDGDTLSWSATNLPGGLSIDAGTGRISGTLTYTAAAGSPYAVTVRATDNGQPAQHRDVVFTWTVADSNRPPAVTDPGDQGTGEGDAVVLVVAGSDPDGDDLTWTATGLPPGLAMDPVSGTISGTVSFSASAGSPYPVLVRATDAGSPQTSTEVTFSWVIAETNRAPALIRPADRTNAEDDPVAFAVNGSDPDGNGLTWSAANLPPGLTIDPATGIVSGRIGFEAGSGSPYTTQVTATDNGSPPLTATVTFTWTVAEKNRPPVLSVPAPQTDAEGDVIQLTPTVSDPDGDSVRWSATGLPPGLVIDPDSGAISGTIEFTGAGGSPYTTQVTARDDGYPSLSASGTFTWIVSDTNRAPELVSPGAQSDAEDDTVTLTLEGSDPDGDLLEWSASGLPRGLSIDARTGTISGTIDFEAADSSPYSVTVTVVDDGVPERLDQVSFSWSVAETNRPPVLTVLADRVHDEGDTVSIAPAASDPDGGSFTWSAVGLPPGASIDRTTGRVFGTLTFEAAGVHPVTITVTDSGAPSLSHERTFTWRVVDVNRPPVVVRPADRSAVEGDPVSFPVIGSDPDGDTLSWSASGLPSGLTLSSSGVVSGEPDFDSAGVYRVTVTAADGGDPELADDASFSITVTNSNRPPVLDDLEDRSDDERTVVTLRPSASDPDGDTLAWSAQGLPPGIAISSVTGAISGTPTTAGEFSVTVTVTDPAGLTDSSSLVWTVRDVNRRPVVDQLIDRNDDRDTQATIQVSGSDPDGDPLDWSAAGLPPGTAFDDGSLVIDGTMTEAGIYTVTVTATDPGGLTGSAVFTWIVVGPSGTPVVIAVPPQQSVVDEPVSLQVAASHPDGLALGYTAAGLPSGLAIDEGTGRIAGTPDTVGLFDVTVRVEDVDGRSASTSFPWEVLPAADRVPVADDDELVVVDGGDRSRVEISVLGNDMDPEGAKLSIIDAGPARIGTVTIDGDIIVFVPPAQWFGTVSFMYTIADPVGNTATARVTVTIEPPLADLVLDDPIVPTLTAPEPSDVVLGSMVQSLYVLRVPLTLLGSAVLSSLLFGGVLNLGFVFRRGIPHFVARRTRKIMAIVLAAQGEKVEAVRSPGSADVVHRFLATDSGIRSSGSEQNATGTTWLEVETESGAAWVESRYLTEHVDRGSFAEDDRIPELLEQFIRSVRVRDPIDFLTSRRGVWIAHHDVPFHVPPEQVPGMFDDKTERVWRGRNPAYPDVVGTIDARVASSILEAWDHPKMELVANQAAVPSTVVPVEFTNCNSVSIGADLQGRERLDQTAWLVFFVYEDDEPRIIALCKEG